ncbi:uncharacterized protein [Diadema antillarum]|uniref:uncharacterized protein n=1 Tax=Diadema antillarum TaxID=105358 RepID=UPI003A89332A
MTDDLTADDLKEKRKWSATVQQLYDSGVRLRFYAAPRNTRLFAVLSGIGRILIAIIEKVGESRKRSERGESPPKPATTSKRQSTPVSKAWMATSSSTREVARPPSPLLLIFLQLLASTQGQEVYITVVASGYADIESSQHGYECYRSDPINANLAFGRTVDIPVNPNHLSSTVDSQPHQDPSYAAAAEEAVFATSLNDANGFGPFYCRGSAQGYSTTQVTTFFSRADAHFVPASGVFTRTVNVGDTGVSISMTKRHTIIRRIDWRKDVARIDNYNELNYLISAPIVLSDEGFYEIHYYNMRSQGRGAVVRLIVRECAAGRWGPPDCDGVCDKCYNGGMCDDKTGLCICPNNFRGPNCLEICRSSGGNRFGRDCEFKCSQDSSDPDDGCSGRLFCLPDPYGCSCDVGVRGLACNDVCGSGMFGPGCSQTCHCQVESNCSPYTGECSSGGCQAGWTGDNCQIPQECDVGYYGPQCTSKCSCAMDAACNRDTGACPGEMCAAGYDKVNCRGISRMTFAKVNPYQPSTVDCYIETAAGGAVSLQTVLYFSDTNGTKDTTGITLPTGGTTNPRRFQVSSLMPGEYACVITMEGRFAELREQADVYGADEREIRV